MPSRSSALSSATTTLRLCPSSEGSALGIASLVAMTETSGRREVAEERDLRLVEYDVARILAETERPVEVYQRTLEAIGLSLGWELGAVWETVPTDQRLRCVCTWHAGAGAPEFEALSERLVLDPGEGLPGRVLLTGEPSWIVDAPTDGNFPRAEVARRSGLHAAFGFPLQSPRGIVGVMEFFSPEVRLLDERLLDSMRMPGS